MPMAAQPALTSRPYMIEQHAFGLQHGLGQPILGHPLDSLRSPLTLGSFGCLAAAATGGAADIFLSISSRHLSAEALTHGCSSSCGIVIRLAGSATSNLLMTSLASSEIFFHSFSKKSYLASATCSGEQQVVSSE